MASGMSHAAIASMDPTNPRWLTSEERTKRSATIWKIIVGAAGASALTAVIVASCLDRDVARRDMQEPSYVETTSAVTTGTTPAPAPAGAVPTANTTDSTGGIAPAGSTTVVTGPGTTINNNTTITSAPVAPRVQPGDRNYTPAPGTVERPNANGDSSTSGVAGTIKAAPAAGPNTGPDGSNINPPTNGATDAVAVPTGPSAGHASHANNDPNNRGSNPESPPMTSGAGRFVTEAPYWSSSAWTSDPEAGAGPFQTERNTPAH